MIHKLKLYFLSHRTDMLMFAMMTIMVTTLALVFTALYQLNKQSDRNEQILKGLSCILLILPENRTQEKVKNCIDINDAGGSNFLFETLVDPMTTDIKALPDEDDNTLLLVPIKGDKGEIGDQGPQGLPGIGIKGDKGEIVIIQGIDGQDGINGEPGAPGREVEFQYNETKQRIEWRYVGDDGWQVLVEQCVLNGNCEET